HSSPTRRSSDLGRGSADGDLVDVRSAAPRRRRHRRRDLDVRPTGARNPQDLRNLTLGFDITARQAKRAPPERAPAPAHSLGGRLLFAFHIALRPAAPASTLPAAGARERAAAPSTGCPPPAPPLLRVRR